MLSFPVGMEEGEFKKKKEEATSVVWYQRAGWRVYFSVFTSMCQAFITDI